MRIALAVLFLAPVVARGRQEEWPVQLKGTRYEVKSDATEKQAAQILKHMELVFETYTKLLGLAKPPDKKMTILLYKDFDEYEASGAPSDTVAYYDGQRLVGYYNEKTMFNYYAHEGFHQFTDVGLKAIEKAPAWFNEGMAECIGNSVVRDKRLFMCVKDGVIATENIGTIRAAIRDDDYVPIRKLLEMDEDTFQGKADLLYPESWSFCHFLMAYPAYEEPKHRIPNGKYWKVLSQYITLMSRADVTPAQALKSAFAVDGKPLDVDRLEKEWKDYVLKWPVKGDGE